MAWEGTTEEFMQLMRGIPAPTVAHFLMRVEAGINWSRSTKASMAEAWSGKSRFSSICTRRDDLATIVARYRAGQKLVKRLEPQVTLLEKALASAKGARDRASRAADEGRTMPVVEIMERLGEAADAANRAYEVLAEMLHDLAPQVPVTPLGPVRRPSPDGQDQGV